MRREVGRLDPDILLAAGVGSDDWNRKQRSEVRQQICMLAVTLHVHGLRAQLCTRGSGKQWRLWVQERRGARECTAGVHDLPLVPVLRVLHRCASITYMRMSTRTSVYIV